MESPQPLAEGAVIDKFVPDTNLSWRVAYAGPCHDPECKENHRQLYVVPMIGWLQVVAAAGPGDLDSFVLRPAVMTTNGVVSDYMDVDDDYALIGVFENSPHVEEHALKIYGARNAQAPDLKIEERSIGMN